MPSEMTAFFRGACASFCLGLGASLAGCGGGGSGIVTPTGTPGPNATPKPSATASATPNGSGPISGSQLVFVSTRSGASELYRASADGTNPVQLTNLARAGIMGADKPSVSPDGRRIVFQYGAPRATATTADPSINLEIAIINTDGTGLIKLTNDTVLAGRPDDYNPVFSADNRAIFWTSQRRAKDAGGQDVDGQPHIWRLDATVGNEAANQSQFVTEISLSPSINRAGNALAYIAPQQTSFPITIQPLSGNSLSGSARRIGGSVAGDSAFDLALSPDGTRIAFSTTGATGMGAAAPAGLRVLDASTGASLGNVSAGMRNSGAAWSRNSQTLYFGATNGSSATSQIFAVDSPFTATPRQITAGAQGANSAPAFLSGN